MNDRSRTLTFTYIRVHNLNAHQIKTNLSELQGEERCLLLLPAVNSQITCLVIPSFLRLREAFLLG